MVRCYLFRCLRSQDCETKRSKFSRQRDDPVDQHTNREPPTGTVPFPYASSSLTEHSRGLFEFPDLDHFQFFLMLSTANYTLHAFRKYFHPTWVIEVFNGKLTLHSANNDSLRMLAPWTGGFVVAQVVPLFVVLSVLQISCLCWQGRKERP